MVLAISRACLLGYVSAAVLFTSSSMAGAAPTGSQTAAAPSTHGEPLDYSQLNHTLAVSLLRAGAHSAKGTNTYAFKATLYGLLNTSEERNLDFAKRKKSTVELGVFGETTLASLSAWRTDEKTKDVKQLVIAGTTIRELTAQTMTDFKAAEGEITVEVEVELMLKKKKYMVLSADESVAKTAYFPIPATKFEAALRTNQELVLEDEKGTFVRLSVVYEAPVALSAKPSAQKNK